MTKANYNQRKRQWNIYHRLEEKGKVLSLKRLSEAGGIEVLNGLFKFMDNPGLRQGLRKLGIARIKTLSRVHSLFGRVKG